MLIIILAIVAGSTEKSVQINDNSVMHITLDYPITDRTSNNLISNFSMNTLQGKVNLGLNDLLKNIQDASRDPKIRGIYLDAGIVIASYPTIDEIREGLIEFKKSGKFILAYADNYTQQGYFLASVADSIFLNPRGLLFFNGLNSESMFISRLLKKAGISMQVFKGSDNKYKSAIEFFTEEKMTEESAGQRSKYIQSAWSYLLTKISETRNISIDSLDQLADSLSLEPNEKLVSKKLIDGYRYKDQIINNLHKLTGRVLSDKIEIISIHEYTNNKIELAKAPNKIAVIFAEGEMVPGESSDGNMGSETISQILRDIRNDSSIKAAVLRINSGGGSAQAAEIIWREAALLSKTKPFIVSMGSAAASGGYYIAAPAQFIMANSMTITGSIGVFGLIPNIQELLNDKLGITYDGVKTNTYADIFNMSRPMTSGEKIIMQSSINNTYKTFVERVAQGRGLSSKLIDQIGRGQIFSGIDAIEIGLVDQIGGLSSAIKQVAEMANVKNYETIEYPKELTLLEQVFNTTENKIKLSIIRSQLPAEYIEFERIKNIMKADKIQTRMAFDVNAN